jgi:hypothetical protein
MTQSIEEHQEISKGEAASMPVGGSRKRRRVRNLAAKHRQKMKERTRGNSGSRRKSTAACMKVSRRARVAWRERSLIRKIRTLEMCGRRKEFAAARIRMTSCEKVARRKERSHEGPSLEGRRKDQTRNEFASGTRKDVRRLDLEGSTGVKDPRTRRQMRLKNGKTAAPIFAKREDESFVGLLKIRNWTLWRGRPLQNEKKETAQEEEPVM